VIRPSRVPTWLVALILSAFVLSACGQAAPPADGSQAPGAASSGPDASGSEAVPGLSAPPIDFADPAGSMATAEAAMHLEDRTRADLKNLGPGAVAFAAAMDASAARALTTMRTDAPLGSLAGQVAGIGPLAPEPGFNTWLVFGTLISTLDDFQRNPQSVTVDMPPETVEVEGNTGTITSTMSVNAVVSGSKLSVDLSMKMKGQVVDRATGAVLYSIDSIVSGHIDLDFCPDAGGHTTANVKLTSSEVYGAGGGSKGVSKEFSGNVGITVGDDANILKVEGTAQGSEDAKGVGPAGGGDAQTSSTRTASDNIANDGNGQRLSGVPRAITLGGEGTTVDQQAGFFGSMSVFVETMVRAAAEEAEKLWKGGKCLELIIDPTSGDVEADEVKDVTATLKHKIEGNELDKPVTATLIGVKSVEPAGEKQPAPATVTFTAGPKEGDVGRIVFKSVSNRGIVERDVTFTVNPAGWKVTFTGTDTEVFAIVTNKFKAEITDLTVKATDQVLSGTGKLHLKGTVTSGPCSGPLNQVASIEVTGNLVGTGPEAMLHVVMRATSPGGQVIHMRCQPSGGADIPAKGHAERFGEPLQSFDLPAANGTVNVNKTGAVGGIFQITVKGTFTVTRTRR
jgi:hypothetical protein